MVREISAGGIVIRKGESGWEIAAIEPQREQAAAAPTAKKGGKKSQKLLLTLPKGLVDPGEKPEQTAVREVFEETGIGAEIVSKLGDTKYVYARTWSDGERVFKIVSFYLLRYLKGKIDDIDPAMRIEVKQAMWIPLEGAEKKIAYKGEKEMVKRAQKHMAENEWQESPERNGAGA